MPKNTPGPWRPGKPGGCVVANSTHATHADEDYYGGNLVAESIKQPNVPLISKAPELLESLRELAQRLRKLEQLTPDLIKAEALIESLSYKPGGMVCPVCKGQIQATRHTMTYYNLDNDEWNGAGKGAEVEAHFYCENDHEAEEWGEDFTNRLLDLSKRLTK